MTQATTVTGYIIAAKRMADIAFSNLSMGAL